MSKHFGTVREPLDVVVGGVSKTFFIRELGYLELQEILHSGASETDHSKRGVAVTRALVIASVEEQDGSKSYTDMDWLHEKRQAVEEISKAVFKAQGLEPKSDEGAAEESSEGNA